MKTAGVVAVALCLAVIALAAQNTDKSQRPSPPGTAEFTFEDGKKVTIEYSRPSAKGRKIMGGLVPYGKVWRTGANEATSLRTDADLVIGTANVPAGRYTLYTIPGQSSWKLIINKQTGQWGTEYDESKDLAGVDMNVTSLSQPVEQFTIAFEKTGNDATKLNLEWEKTRASVDIKEKK